MIKKWLFVVFFSEKMDEEVVQDGVRVIIDKKAQLTLLGILYLYITNENETK